MSKTTENAPEYLELSMRLTSGKFNTSVRIPIGVGEDEMKAGIRSWMDVIDTALRLGREHQLSVNMNVTRHAKSEVPSHD